MSGEMGMAERAAMVVGTLVLGGAGVFGLFALIHHAARFFKGPKRRP